VHAVIAYNSSYHDDMNHKSVFSARSNIYLALCYDVSVRLSVRLSVCDGSALAHYS